MTNATPERRETEGLVPVNTLVFAGTLFLSSFLLFVVELFVGKSLLPLLGGSPAVWNTCVLFFQAMLLAGYVWAHLGHRLGGARLQALVQAVLVLLSLGLLPMGLGSARPPAVAHPVPWLLATLAATVGFPFFVLASTAPLLQRWFSQGSQRRAADPYFLYAASNAGSLAGLIAYPTLLEPLLPLHAQSIAWSLAYGVAGLLTIACAALGWRTAGGREATLRSDRPAEPRVRDGATPRERLRWVLLAAVPSSLMLGLTTYATMDIAAIPLLWMLPLATYLLTMILSFVDPPIVRTVDAIRWQPVLAIPLIIFLFWGSHLAVPALLPLHLVALFVTGLMCHGQLAASRPAASRLTEYYLYVALGGALGGLANVLVAPALLDSVLEYPLVLAVAYGVGASAASGVRAWSWSWSRLRGPLIVVVALLGSRQLLLGFAGSPRVSTTMVIVMASIASCLAAIACYRKRGQPLFLSAYLLAIVVVGGMTDWYPGHTLLRERDFFGVRRVTADGTGGLHILFNGTTIHGAQRTDPSHRREPVSYYGRRGPLGNALAALQNGRPQRVGVVGLGAGAAAAYARPGDQWVFYELDPNVEHIARDPRYFTYLADSRGAVRVVLGDGRLSLAHEPDGSLDLLLLDAFSSDAIPVHLLTREALALYFRKLAPHGALLFHLSNRFVSLESVLGGLVRDAGVAARVRSVPELPADDLQASTWAVVARNDADLGPLAADPRWRPLPTPAGRAWTDEYSNVLTFMRVFRK